MGREEEKPGCCWLSAKAREYLFYYFRTLSCYNYPVAGSGWFFAENIEAAL
jgi:hypothetical protein